MGGKRGNGVADRKRGPGPAHASTARTLRAADAAEGKARAKAEFKARPPEVVEIHGIGRDSTRFGAPIWHLTQGGRCQSGVDTTDGIGKTCRRYSQSFSI